MKKWKIASHGVENYTPDAFEEIDFEGTEKQVNALCELMEHMALLSDVGEYSCNYEEVLENDTEKAIKAHSKNGGE